jgi:hypothetical protein
MLVGSQCGHVQQLCMCIIIRSVIIDVVHYIYDVFQQLQLWLLVPP